MRKIFGRLGGRGVLSELLKPSFQNYMKDPSVTWPTSRIHLRTKVTPDFHLTYSKNGENLGSGSK